MSADDERDRDEERANEQLLRDEQPDEREQLNMAALHSAHLTIDEGERRIFELERQLVTARIAIRLLGDSLRSIAAAGDAQAVQTLRTIAHLGALHSDNALAELER